MNLIVQGDNLVALKALPPHCAGQLKCISIDPPYNTANEGWANYDNAPGWMRHLGRDGQLLELRPDWDLGRLARRDAS